MKRVFLTLSFLVLPTLVLAQMPSQPTCEQQLRVLDTQYQSFQRSSYQSALDQQMRSDAQVKALEAKVKEIQVPKEPKAEAKDN